ncbi:FtsX-like permease family protein [Conexibacter arvalis]|uniref:Putative ABC transport system permease protein n=1 Tax=Conexibacter arvalis TaxID=912552 RepID=A0A840IDJ8_9ACTN|nr:putative ABC transport system permease protein [Conexibacter arvalis]
MITRARNLLVFYRWRLRRQWAQELLAGLGIAVGVALVFAVQVANTSISGSQREVIEGIAGTATLQLVSRDARGFDQELLAQTRALPSVAEASAVLEQRATLISEGADGRRHRAAVDLVGIDSALPSLGGVATRNLRLGGELLSPGLILPRAVGDALALPKPTVGSEEPPITVSTRGRAVPSRANAVVDASLVGPLEHSILAIGSIDYVQRLTGLRERANRVVVSARPGRQEDARRELETLAGGRVSVASVDSESEMLDAATVPIDQATGLFAAIAGFVGLLFAFNAMLLTVPERRRMIAMMRKIGFSRGKVAVLLISQAVILGTVASLVGLALGYLLSQTAAHSSPSYLSFAFPLGVHPVIAVSSVVISFAGGVLVACLAAAQPLLDLRPSRPVNAALTERGEPGHSLSRGVRRSLATAAIAVVAVTTVLVLWRPSLTVAGVALLAVATVLITPWAFSVALLAGDRVSHGGRLNALLLAVWSLRATTIRSLALAATGAVAVFGSVAIEGAHRNLLDGLDRNFAEYLAPADVWVTAGGDENSLTTQSFAAGILPQQLERVEGVDQVRRYYGGMLDLDDRRVWVIGRPAADDRLVPPSQIRDGASATVQQRLREGGWVALSDSLADKFDAEIGDPVAIPTPSGPMRLRLAARLTNMGWSPGAVVMNDRDYQAGWPDADPSALEIVTAPGASADDVAAAMREVVDADALNVQTTPERLIQFEALARQGLDRLSQISFLLLIAAAGAMASAMAAGMWQRRVEFAQQRARGFSVGNLWRRLCFETVLVLLTGCATGALLGLYGHALGNRWLQLSTGYPAPFDATPLATLATCGLIAAVAFTITAIAGSWVARTPARVGLSTSG